LFPKENLLDKSFADLKTKYNAFFKELIACTFMICQRHYNFFNGITHICISFM